MMSRAVFCCMLVLGLTTTAVTTVEGTPIAIAEPEIGPTIGDTTSPFFIDHTFTAPGEVTNGEATGRAVIDLATGTLKARAEGLLEGFVWWLQLTARDEFTLNGVAPGTPIPITAGIVADGTAFLPLFGSSVQAQLAIFSSGAAGTDEEFFSPRFTGAPQGSIFPFDMAAETSFTALAGVPFELTYSLYVDEANLGIIDLLNTAQLVFSLPDGVTVQSEGGFHSSEVPEPASLTMLVLGLGGFAIRTRARSRSSNPNRRYQ